jgi:RIO kinase 1
MHFEQDTESYKPDSALEEANRQSADRFEELATQFEQRNRTKSKSNNKKRRSHKQVLETLTEQAENSLHSWSGVAWPSRAVPRELESAADTRLAFNPTFHSSRHEREWIINYLGPFYEDALIVDVLHQVKGGKEATVYCCRAHPATGVELIAAKVYRPRMFRSLRNDSLYRQGRATLDEEGKTVKRGRRVKLAVAKRTKFGQEVLHNNWLANEFETLRVLHRAGADVPMPFAAGENAMLILYLGAEGKPAPTLNHVRLDPKEARRLFERVLWNVELMLAHKRIHADLSAYNLLYWNDALTLIDFPQAVDPLINPRAFELLTRDLQRVCDHFARYGIHANAQEIALEMWKKQFG